MTNWLNHYPYQPQIQTEIVWLPSPEPINKALDESKKAFLEAVWWLDALHEVALELNSGELRIKAKREMEIEFAYRINNGYRFDGLNPEVRSIEIMLAYMANELKNMLADIINGSYIVHFDSHNKVRYPTWKQAKPKSRAKKAILARQESSWQKEQARLSSLSWIFSVYYIWTWRWRDQRMAVECNSEQAFNYYKALNPWLDLVMKIVSPDESTSTQWKWPKYFRGTDKPKSFPDMVTPTNHGTWSETRQHPDNISVQWLYMNPVFTAINNSLFRVSQVFGSFSRYF